MSESLLNIGDPSLFRDLRTGNAGAIPRVAISLVTALVLVAVSLFAVWFADSFSPFRGDSAAPAAFGGAGLAWCLAQMWIWRSYGRFRVILNGVFSFIAIWAVVIPICVMVAEAVRRNEEMLIIGCVLCGVAGTLLRLAVLWHQHSRGRDLTDVDGRVNVNCPDCGYVMVGLSESRCPECGERFTLDELIRRQDYQVLRSAECGSPPPVIETRATVPPGLERPQPA